jgi:hypothetical protein
MIQSEEGPYIAQTTLVIIAPAVIAAVGYVLYYC